MMTPLLFLAEMAGFALQTAPIAVLCFLPFAQNELRLSRKVLWTIVAVLEAVGALGMGCFTAAFNKGDPNASSNVGNYFMFLFLLLFFCLYFWAIRTKLAAKVLPLILLIQYAAFLFLLNTILLQASHVHFGVPYLNMSYHPVTVLTSFALTAITFPLMVLFFKKVLQPMFPLMGRRDLSRGCYFFAAALVLYFIEVYLLTFAPSALENVFMVMALVCMTLTDMILYYIFFSQIRLTAQNQQLAEQLRQFDEQYRVITGNVEEARRFRHDLRQHLNVISELNQENRRAELTAYLERYTESYQALDSQPLTGFFAVDNILRHYLARAQSEGVRVQTELGRFEDGLGFDPTDITVLLGNLLENALEACRKIPRPEERSLSISLRQREGALLISLANNCPTGSAEFSSFVGASSFPSTKRDGGRHGLGLKSVQMVADKYGGSAEYKREGGVFTARVVLNVP